ncbi:CoA ester lyase [Sphingomonas sp.]|uniref:HpcH/HpaI aldolase/citrate lyase family protein n=1 Tax=Sphingomonas sp. TaxID=28214 RepID=UPI002BDD23E6|nr:CoA ester lyase [Sphingomonas sp.]HTG39699.1 CoA ester lyase [Sphingomonas sp.]
MSTAHRQPPRTALFLPAANARAIEKARGLAVDMVVLDLEDSVRDDDKNRARAAAVAAAATGFGHRLVAIRVNGEDHGCHEDDVAAVAVSAADFIVVPKVETVELAERVAGAGKPLLAMIETPLGVLNAAAIARVDGVEGLVAGVNDLRATLGIPDGDSRAGLTTALQMIVLAARAGGGWALDGVFNALDDDDALAAECREGRAMGFDGKTLIHPNQIAVATRAFAPGEREIAHALALIEAATGGAERFGGRMIETMHVEQARALLARAGRD